MTLLGKSVALLAMILGLVSRYAQALESGDGRIACTRLTEGYWQIWSMNADGDDELLLTSGPSDKRHPAWSNDGSFLVYNDYQGNLYRISSSGGEPKMLMPDLRPFSESDLSPDDELVFLRIRQAPGYLVQVWTTELSGRDRRLLTRAPLRHLQPTWSPDGARIAVAQIDKQREINAIVTMDREGGDLVTWFESTDGLTSPSWSPDGRALAFSRDMEGDHDIWAIPQGGEPTRLTFDPGLDISPVYSPSGREILFVSRRSGGYQLWRIPSEGGQAEQVTNGLPCRDPAWWAPRSAATATFTEVELSKRVLVASEDSPVRVQYTTGTDAVARLEVSNASGALVRRVAAGPDSDGWLAWDGSDEEGTFVESGLYFLRLVAGVGGQEFVWDPTEQTGGQRVNVLDLRLDETSKRVLFEVPTPAWVRVRMGLHEGPLFETVEDWTPMAAGPVAIEYPGDLAPGWKAFWDHPDRDASVAAFSWPDNAVLVRASASGSEPSGELLRAWHSRRSDRDLFSHARHRQDQCEDPVIQVTIANAAEGSFPPEVSEAATIRINAKTDTGRRILQSSLFEVMIYVDDRFLMEDEDSTLPFHYTLDTSLLSEGDHSFLVMVAGFQDHMGAAFAPFTVVRGAGE